MYDPYIKFWNKGLLDIYFSFYNKNSFFFYSLVHYKQFLHSTFFVTTNLWLLLIYAYKDKNEHIHKKESKTYIFAGKCWNLAVTVILTGVFPTVATPKVCDSLLSAITIVAAVVANNARTLNNITKIITRDLLMLPSFTNFSSAICAFVRYKNQNVDEDR